MPTITRLPLDIEGTKPSNWRANESHAVVTAIGKTNRVIVPEFGAFFVKGAEVRDANGVALVRHQNVEFTYHYEMFSELAGQGVCALIVITDKTLKAPFTISYQAVGGNFSLSVRELADVIDYITYNLEKLKWEDIIDKPTAYTPKDHMHKYWQLYGLDTVVTNLNRLGDAWAVGRKSILAANKTYYLSYAVLMQQALDAYKAKVQAHLTDVSNPHQSDKTKIGLSNINNWPLATYIESVNPTIKDKYQPIGGVYNQLIAESIPVLNTHIADKATLTKPDPHNLTLAQLGVYSTAQINNIFNQRLRKDQTAYDTNTIVGVTWPAMYAHIRANLDTSNIDQNTRFNQYQMGVFPGGVAASQCALLGNNTFGKYSDLMGTYNSTQGSIYHIGSYATIGAMHTAAAGVTGITGGTWLIGNFQKPYYDIKVWGLAAFIRNWDGSTSPVIY